MRFIMAEEDTVKIEVCASGDNILVKYTAPQGKVSSMKSAHYSHIPHDLRRSSCAEQDDGIIIKGVKNDNISLVEGRYRIEVASEYQAQLLRSLLRLPEIRYGRMKQPKDIKWVVEFGTSFDYDKWYDSISDVPPGKTSMSSAQISFNPNAWIASDPITSDSIIHDPIINDSIIKPHPRRWKRVRRAFHRIQRFWTT